MSDEPETHVQMKVVAFRQQLIAHSKDDTMFEDPKTQLQTEMAALRQQLLADIRAELEEFREKLLTELTEEFVLTVRSFY